MNFQNDPIRFTKREEAIKIWLSKNNADSFLIQAENLLAILPSEQIENEFFSGIERGIKFCNENETIYSEILKKFKSVKALDFQWYFDGNTSDVAFAYALDSCKGFGNISGTDLGPREIPGIESDLKHGYLVYEDFSSIPVHHSINSYVENLQDPVRESIDEDRISSEVEVLLLDLFQIWNYKIAYEVCKRISDWEGLKKRSPFWVTMTRHDRWSVPIFLIDKNL
ncbi:hypothetical protein [Leptospira sp. Pond_2020]|uniref:LIC13197/LIC10919/LIC10469 family protein n=1 Tax=Leptospira sp. Pond_2020 TaxID=2846916 RepID=UPI001E4F7BA8|nr:hypothetical protein [Leptospira sp. Pond_2020]MCD1183404.1 hypothetical protein [Leptospira sp. Pond_2020]